MIHGLGKLWALDVFREPSVRLPFRPRSRPRPLTSGREPGSFPERQDHRRGRPRTAAFAASGDAGGESEALASAGPAGCDFIALIRRLMRSSSDESGDPSFRLTCIEHELHATRKWQYHQATDSPNRSDPRNELCQIRHGAISKSLRSGLPCLRVANPSAMPSEHGKADRVRSGV
jgi:hypothetical protein